MKKFSLLATVFAAVGLFSSVAAQAEIKPVTLKFAHIYAAEDHWGQTAERFKAYGFQAFEGVSSAPDSLTNRGYDEAYGAGVRVGWFGRITPWLEAFLGALPVLFVSGVTPSLPRVSPVLPDGFAYPTRLYANPDFQSRAVTFGARPPFARNERRPVTEYLPCSHRLPRSGSP